MAAERRIGLLGGSFNPAHAGHVHISLEARKWLGLDEIWWLVSPQNPLKPTDGMADFEQRFDYARKLTASVPFIHISDFEQQHHTQYTVDAIRALRKQHPEVQFVWLMGADNLVQFHCWSGWQRIAAMVPFAVLDRAEYREKAMESEAARALKDVALPAEKATKLTQQRLPAWVFLPIELHEASATELRQKGETPW